jgi:regulator of cell morphogenesis and NO signaling
MNITEQSLIGELVARDYRMAAVFNSHKIDFCCKGNRTIREVCEDAELKPEDLLTELSRMTRQAAAAAMNPDTWPLDLLVDYIEKKHHRYVESRMGEIEELLKKLLRVHGVAYPELLEVEELFHKCTRDLTVHMRKEELVLFPVIRKISAAMDRKEPMRPPRFGSVRNPISMMHHEHEAEGERFRNIAELTDNYTPPAEACQTHRLTYALLKEFEEDLHVHIHLENNLLFPKAVEMEDKLACLLPE